MYYETKERERSFLFICLFISWESNRDFDTFKEVSMKLSGCEGEKTAG